MRSYEVEKNSKEWGDKLPADLKSKLDERTAVFMITNPNTLGVFEDQIVEIAEIVHDIDVKDGKFARPEVAGVEALIAGLGEHKPKERLTDDVAHELRTPVATITAAVGFCVTGSMACLHSQIETVPAALQNRLGIAVSGTVYRAYRESLAAPAWQSLAARGARPQVRPATAGRPRRPRPPAARLRRFRISSGRRRRRSRP